MYFEDLDKLSLAFFSTEIKTVQLPNLAHCNNLKITSLFFQRTDSLTFSGYIYGSTFAVYGDSLQYLLFSEVVAVGELRSLELSAFQLKELNLKGLITNSTDLDYGLYLNSIESFDFNKLPLNTVFDKLIISGHSFSEIQFSEKPIIINDLSIKSESLEKLSSGITSINNLKKPH